MKSIYKKTVDIKTHYLNPKGIKKMLCGKSRLHKYTSVKNEVTCIGCKKLLEEEILNQEIK